MSESLLKKQSAQPQKIDAHGFFSKRLSQSDDVIADMIEAERQRQQDQIELIASENIVSRAVLEAQGSVLTNKYAEGYPGRRYYGGCDYVDEIERLAVERAKTLFGCAYANLQPHSGSQANLCVLLALLQPNDCVLGMSLDAGGHLSHGARPNISGKWFQAQQYGVREDDHLIDMKEVEHLAQKHRPRLIIAGGSAYARHIDFAAFRAIADDIGAYLMVDMAHFAGLVAAGLHPSPLPIADIVTTTTHKTLRGPRGGMILTNDEALNKKISSAMFPGLQGGPLMHVIAAKAIALQEALRPDFKIYIQAVLDNAKILASVLSSAGFDLVSAGTDTHLLLVDIRSKSVNGKIAQEQLERVNITCNKNAIPNDPLPPTQTSGLRLGTPACTTRGFGVAEMNQIGHIFCEALDCLQKGSFETQAPHLQRKTLELTDRFPIYRAD